MVWNSDPAYIFTTHISATSSPPHLTIFFVAKYCGFQQLCTNKSYVKSWSVRIISPIPRFLRWCREGEDIVRSPLAQLLCRSREGGRGRAKEPNQVSQIISYNNEKVWSSINHSILSGHTESWNTNRVVHGIPVTRHSVCFFTSVSSAFRANSSEFRGISRNSVSHFYTKFREIPWYFFVQNFYISKGTHLKAPVIETHSRAAQAPFLLTCSGATKTSAV